MPHPTGDGTAVTLTFTNLEDMNKYLSFFRAMLTKLSYEFMPVSFEVEQQSGKPYSSSSCESLLQVTLSLSKPQTNASIKIPENPNRVEDKKQGVITVIKTNKQRRRK